MSSYTFPLDDLFDYKPSSDLYFSQFFEFSDSVHESKLEQVTETDVDDQMQSALKFEKMCEYRDESLSDVVLGSSCRRAHESALSDHQVIEIEPTKIETQIWNPCGFVSNFNLRRACSTGDLSDFTSKHVLQTQRSFSDRLPPSLEEPDSHKAGRYTAEQRRVSIDKYRAKRSLRNFNKTIKYECRKTLADNRPRIRGRFKRNEDTVEFPKHGEEDGIWMERFHAMSCEETLIFGGQILSDYGQTQFVYPSSIS